MWWSQPGQREPGVTIDSRRRSRYASTFTKLPIAPPKAPRNARSIGPPYQAPPLQPPVFGGVQLRVMVLFGARTTVNVTGLVAVEAVDSAYSFEVAFVTVRLGAFTSAGSSFANSATVAPLYESCSVK